MTAEGSADPKTRLLDAAEQLVAERGWSVPTRDIVERAGHRNVSAVQYHFGSRDALLDAVFFRITSFLIPREAELLADVERRGLERDPRSLLSVWVRPYAELLARQAQTSWARYCESWIVTRPVQFYDDWITEVIEDEGHTARGGVEEDVQQRLDRHLRAVCASGVEPFASERLNLIVRSNVAFFATWERDRAARRPDLMPLDDFAGLVLDMLTAMASALVSEPPTR